jgi:hypothetical protein
MTSCRCDGSLDPCLCDASGRCGRNSGCSSGSEREKDDEEHGRRNEESSSTRDASSGESVGCRTGENPETGEGSGVPGLGGDTIQGLDPAMGVQVVRVLVAVELGHEKVSISW